jgi:hypothetical protein
MTQTNTFGICGTNISTTISKNFGTNIHYVSQKKYHVLGEDIEVSTHYQDTQLVNIISTLNVLGRPYYEQLIKNDFQFPPQIEDFIQKKFKEIDREIKISQVIN